MYRNNENQFGIRPTVDPRHAVSDYDLRSKQQVERYQRHQADNEQHMRELAERQKIAEDRQKQAMLRNATMMNPGLGKSQSVVTAAHTAHTAEPAKDTEVHRQRGKVLRPDVFNLNADDDLPIEEPEVIERPRSIVIRQKSASVKPKEPSSDSDDGQEEEEAERLRKQNETIKQYIEKLRSEKASKQEANKYQTELERLNQLEGKLYDYNRHMESVKGLNRLGDDLNRIARSQALAAIKSGQVRKDAEMRDILKQFTEGSKPKNNKDPWARKMIQALASQQMPQQQPMRQLDPSMFARPSPSPKKEGSIDSEKQKKQEKKIKKLNEELEKNKKALEAANKDPVQNQGLMSKDEVAKAINEALEKQKAEHEAEVEKKAREVGAGPEDVVTLPNGVSVIRPKDKTKPPIFIMPDDNVEKLKKKMTQTKSSMSSTSSISETIAPKPNPLQQMMLGMLMAQNMKMMMGDEKSSVSSVKSKRSISSSQSRLPPLIINPPMYMPPPQPIYQQLPPQQKQFMPSESLPKVGKKKPTVVKRSDDIQSQIQQPLPQVQRQIPQVQQQFPQVQPVRPSSVRSESTNGQPVQPPVKSMGVYNFNAQNLDGPRPAANIDIDRSPSLRDQQMQSQSTLSVIS